jgi:hypothetical protein
MIEEKIQNPLAWINDPRERDRLLRLAIRDAYAEHKRNGTSIVVWEDGKIVTIPAEEIVVPEIEE